MKKVCFFQGAFDIINAGHILTIQNLSSEWDLVIGLNSDELMRYYKREPIIPFEQRRIILEGIKGVSRIVKCHEPMAIHYLKQLNADVYACVKEWKEQQREAIDWIIAKGGEVFEPHYYPEDGDILSSSMIRERVIKGGS
jgi:bifunctional ADP-heptose synthase (sugar kinase/adenylyltransferase)